MRNLLIVFVVTAMVLMASPVRAATGGDGTIPVPDGPPPNGYVEDAVLIKFAAGFPARSLRDAFAAANGLEEVFFTPKSHFFRFRITDGSTPDQKIAQLDGQPDVLSVTRIPRGERHYVPPDPLYPNQWYLPQVNMPAAWDLAGGGSTSYIALVDSGVQQTPDHEDLGVIAGWNFLDGNSDVNDLDGHGTTVAGIMAAFTGAANGTKGIAGINYNAAILVAKDGNAQPAIDLTAAGIEWAVNRGAAAINVSTGYRNVTAEELEVLRQAVEYAWYSNRPVVASSGNDGATIRGVYPAAFTTVITVGATTRSDTRAAFSNSADMSASPPLYIDLAAPGVEMCTTAISNTYSCSPGPDGTSYSAPMVTGTLGLLEGRYPNLTSADMKARLSNSADKVGGYSYSGTYCGGLSAELGCGRLDAAGTVP